MTSMDIDDGASLELVDMFCYLGDTLSVDSDADVAVEARVCKWCNKFRQLVPLSYLEGHLTSYEREVISQVVLEKDIA